MPQCVKASTMHCAGVQTPSSPQDVLTLHVSIPCKCPARKLICVLGSICISILSQQVKIIENDFLIISEEFSYLTFFITVGGTVPHFGDQKFKFSETRKN